MKTICDNENYQIAGPNEDSIGLPVTFKDLPENIRVNEYDLSLKNSFHITLIPIGNLMERYQISIPDFKEKVLEDFCNFVRENKIEVLRYKDEFRFASQDKKRTVVQMCELINLNKFFDLLNSKYSLKLEYPPTHVTLYTLEHHGGIFLIDSKDIENLTTSIPSLIR